MTTPPDSPTRCFGDGDPLYECYHDDEWARPIVDSPDERELFERLALEGFQSGLAWIIVLRKREAFREAFADFAPGVVARFTDDDVARLMTNPGIVRNQAKIRATITGAQVLLAMHERGETLRAMVERYRPPERPAPQSWQDVPAQTEGSAALAKELKAAGFRFLGPTTVYAAMQAIGLVNDHLVTCAARDAAARPAAPH